MRNAPSGYEPLDHAALMAQAKQRARTLRREAVPAFWDGLDAVCTQVGRSLTRFLYRLTRHTSCRGEVHKNDLNVKDV